MENYLKPDTKALRDSFGQKMVGLSELGQPKPTAEIEVAASTALDDDLLQPCSKTALVENASH